MNRTLRRWLAALGLVLLAALPLAAAAAPDTKGKDGWENVSGDMIQSGESIPASRLVAAAYGFIWVMVMGFVVSVWSRAGRLEREIADLRKQIAAAGHQPPRK